MTSRARTRGRVIPRDEHVTRGIEANDNAHQQFEYKFNFKIGTSRTRVATAMASNRISLFGMMIADHAEEGRDFFLFNIQRSLRYQRKVRDF